ncbi:peptidoglycan-binding protein [Streptomyces bluensis]|uniref:peptidoglycan-binding domain-containing protein n=1 Tax=Streptomyces bluensis TaxID=33897 RepID=UPI0036B56D7D
MSEASGNGGDPHRRICPECAAPRTLDGTPSCSCNRRASQALRDARTAEAAAAEDFDPLRIRPYVELGGEPERTPADAPPSTARQPDDVPTLAMPVASTTTRPDSADVRLFEDGTPEPAGAEPETEPAKPEHTEATPPSPPGRTPRRNRRVPLALAAAAATVLAAAGFAGGLFSYDTPTRDHALPDDLRASVPDTSADDEASSEPSGATPSAGPATNAPPAPSDTSPSASPSTPDSSARPSSSPSPTPSAPSPSVTASESPGSDEVGEERSSRTLRLGDDGPEVTELQLRLRQVAVYFGDIDENFDEQVEAAVRRYQFTRDIDEDDRGVYGGATREKLESETEEP